MPSPLPILGAVALAVCGLAGAPAVVGAASVRVPWDAAGLGPSGTPLERLVRRPVDPAIRVAVARGAPADVTAPTAVALLASVDRWGRGQPPVCLEAAEVAWALGRRGTDPAAYAAGDRLLRTYLRRTPGGQVAGVRSWMRDGDPAADARAVFGSLPAPITALAGSVVGEKDADAGWDLLLPALTDPAVAPEAAAGHLRRAVELAERRRRPEDAALLRAIAARTGAPTDLRERIERLVPAPAEGR